MAKIQPFVAFDLEIADDIPEGGEIDDYRLGVTCAATFDSDGKVTVWKPVGSDFADPQAPYSKKMSPQKCVDLLRYLFDRHRGGARIVTWNGMGFDLRVLGLEARLDLIAWDNLVKLAWNHIDVAFQMLCENGYMVGLDKAAKGMGLAGKTEGMSGAKAPEMWRQGREAQDKVLEYVVQDARTTALLYNLVVATGSMSWITKRGTPARFPWRPTRPEETGGARLLTVAEANQLPLPDTSWMDTVRHREQYTEWATIQEATQ